MTVSNPAVTLSIRILPELREQLEEIAEATGRTKSFLAAEAIKNYLEVQAWQVAAIKQAVEKTHSTQAKFVSHQEVVKWASDLSRKKRKALKK